MSASGKTRIFTEEHRANIAKGKTGSKHSPQTMAKLVGRVRSAEHKANISAAKKGKPGHKPSPETIAKLVEYHVHAKRYLTYKYPAYYAHLSEASKKTLEFQGGVMHDGEAEAFQKDPLFETSILMRNWDDLAKEANRPIIPIDQLKRKAKIILEKARNIN